MSSLHYTQLPVAIQISPQAAANLQNRASAMALLIALSSALIFWIAQVFLPLPLWGWIFVVFGGGLFIGLWLWAPNDASLKWGSITALALFSMGLGGVSQPEELLVFFSGFFPVWIFNLLFFRLFFSSAKWAATFFWIFDALLLGAGLYFLPPPYSVQATALALGALWGFLDALHFLWAQDLMSRRHGEHEIFRAALTAHLEIIRSFMLWLLPSSEDAFHHDAKR
jgi:hypothetical protein